MKKISEVCDYFQVSDSFHIATPCTTIIASIRILKYGSHIFGGIRVAKRGSHDHAVAHSPQQLSLWIKRKYLVFYGLGFRAWGTTHTTLTRCLSPYFFVVSVLLSFLLVLVPAPACHWFGVISGYVGLHGDNAGRVT